MLPMLIYLRDVEYLNGQEEKASPIKHPRENIKEIMMGAHKVNMLF